MAGDVHRIGSPGLWIGRAWAPAAANSYGGPRVRTVIAGALGATCGISCETRDAPFRSTPREARDTALRDRRIHYGPGWTASIPRLDPASALTAEVSKRENTAFRTRASWFGPRLRVRPLFASRFRLQPGGDRICGPGSPRSGISMLPVPPHGVDSRWSGAVEQLSVNYASLPRGSLHLRCAPVMREGQLSLGRLESSCSSRSLCGSAGGFSRGWRARIAAATTALPIPGASTLWPWSGCVPALRNRPA